MRPRDSIPVFTNELDVNKNTSAGPGPARMPVSPGIISISSKNYSSRSTSSAGPEEAETRSHQTEYRLAQMTSKITDEDKLLMANRRRLLARTDWLGLGAGRPVQMKFANSHDKDRIGKRRRVLKTTPRKGQPAEKLLVSPLFRDTLLRPDHLMSGAIPEDDIHVKVGTDALASQTQRSRHSHTPGHTSMRHPSTEFGPHSEESMLLDADDSTFEMTAVKTSAENIPTPSAADAFADSFSVNAGSQKMRPTQYSVQVSEFVPDSDPAQHRDLMPAEVPPDDCEVARVHPKHSNAGDHVTHARGGQAPIPNMIETKNKSDDEVWRRIMDIGKMDSSHDSMLALDSASQHLTTSDSRHRPRINVADAPYDTQHSSSTPQGAGTQPSRPDRNQLQSNGESSSKLVASLQSPSASLQRIVELAQQPAPPNHQAQEEADDDALWRDFIVGSQDSSDQSPQDVHFPTYDAEKDIVQPVRGSSAFNVSDLGTSNKSTLGDTLFVTQSSTSAMSTILAKRRDELSSQDNENSGTSHKSMRAGAKADQDGVESIEDPPSPARRKRRSDNIHVHETSVLNPKRFKPLSKKPAPPHGRQRTSLPSRKARKDASTRLQSIYDLVDSDGLSVA